MKPLPTKQHFDILTEPADQSCPVTQGDDQRGRLEAQPGNKTQPLNTAQSPETTTDGTEWMGG
ncbi:hypothetical protein EYF80_016034 [Liparis tanakae]|uniref:Uncharacterized protein n=1 Tax=Liparis tanakae TaxID=230148 RepID=A0A4Z2I8G7_9TELE|nr:hypothetical protein EYF80_016034 [Liparis tanakae]